MWWHRKKRTRKAKKALSKAEKCATKWCPNERAHKTTRYQSPKGHVVVYENRLKHCWKCRARWLKEHHPATYVLNTLRRSAKRRRLPFTITLAEFKWFCLRTGYLEVRGHKPGAMTIDRIDSNRGYHIDNIQVKEFLDNCEGGSDNTPREERGCETVAEPF